MCQWRLPYAKLRIIFSNNILAIVFSISCLESELAMSDSRMNHSVDLTEFETGLELFAIQFDSLG